MKFIKYTIAIVIFTLANSSWAQDNMQFQVLDNKSNPLIGATFIYHDQYGVTDQNGTIKFTYIEGSIMYLSYLGYGKWAMDDDAILKAVQNGIFTKQEVTEQIQPITVIALRPKISEDEQIKFSYSDKMVHDGGELLSQTPVISGIRKGGNYGLDPVMRGFKYDQLNIVMNGTQCATAACPNRMDPPTSQMAPNMLNRVEILKGPHALRFGGGLGGTINFVTGEPQFYDQAKVYGRVSGKYDTNGEIYKTEAMTGIAGKRFNVAIFGSIAKGNDYEDGGDKTVQADFQRSSIGLKTGFLVTDNQTIEVTAFQNKAKDVDFPALMMDLRSDNTLMINGTHKIQFQNKNLQSWTTTLFSSTVDHLMDNKLKPLEPRMMDASTNAETSNIGGRTEGVWKIDHSKLYIGFDYKIEEAKGIRERNFLLGPMKGKTVFDNAWQHGRISKAGLFGEYNYRLNGWQFVFSGRLEMNSAKVLDADPGFLEEYPEPVGSQINSSMSLGGLRNFDNNISFGLWVARAQRSASLAERFINKFSIGQDPYEMIGNPDLSPEINNQIDLTFEWKHQKAALNVDFFGSYMQDFISSVIDPDISTILPNRPGVRRFVNIDKAYKTGFELSYSHKFTNWLCTDIGMAYTYAQDLERDQPLPEIAPLDFRLNICGMLFAEKVRPKFTYRYVSGQNRISTEYGESTTPSFDLVDFQVDFAIHANWNFQLGVSNLFDKTYYEHLNRSTAGTSPTSLNAPGRNFFAAFNYTFL